MGDHIKLTSMYQESTHQLLRFCSLETASNMKFSSKICKPLLMEEEKITSVLNKWILPATLTMSTTLSMKLMPGLTTWPLLTQALSLSSLLELHTKDKLSVV